LAEGIRDPDACAATIDCNLRRVQGTTPDRPLAADARPAAKMDEIQQTGGAEKKSTAWQPESISFRPLQIEGGQMEPGFEMCSGDIIAWIVDGSAVHLKCITRQGDPVELELQHLCEALLRLAKDISN
jgi:hypothetical protein